MKTLLLMRHAKAVPAGDAVSDHERPLAPRGREAAPGVGAWLKKRKLVPGLVICSTAKRVQETLDLVLGAFPHKPAVKKSRQLYMALPREILAEIARTPGDTATLMVLGHNPGIGTLAHWLAGYGDKQHIARVAAKFPTAALAVLEFDVESWKEVDAGTGTLRHYVTPKGGDDEE